MLNPEGGELAGVGHYTTHLVGSLVKAYKKDEYVLFFDHHMPQAQIAHLAERENVRIVRFPFSQHKKYLPFGYSHVFVASVLKQQHLDVFHSPAYVIPMQYNRPSVVTVHDLAIYQHPSWFPPKQTLSRSLLVPRSIKKADKVIAVSNATKKSIRQLFKVPEERIATVYEGFTKGERVTKATKEAVKKKFGLSDDFILFVGTVEPRKNLVSLVKAFDHFMNENFQRHKGLQLIIAGGRGWKYNQIFRTIARAKWSANVRVIGYITHEEKIALLESCVFFAFPSLWEGFGLPVLEAASLGVPVLTSKVSALPEVAGDGALYARPDSVRSIQDGITTLMRSTAKRKVLATKGKEHSKQFSWVRCAKETHDVYASVVNASQK